MRLANTLLCARVRAHKAFEPTGFQMATQIPTGFVPGPQALKHPPGAPSSPVALPHPQQPPPARLAEADLDAVQNLKNAHIAIRNELRKVIVGQENVIDELLIA